MKCKNCGKETENDKVYCSLTCRNIYVNKNLRDYSKITKINDIKREKQQIKYYEEPKLCKFCNEIIKFENKDKDFCNHSCCAKFNNKNRKGIKHTMSEGGLRSILIANKKRKTSESIEYDKNPKFCLNCGEVIEYRKKSNNNCSIKCRNEFFSKNKDDFELYRSLTKFKFHLKDFNNEFDFSLIEKYGWYKAKNNGDNVDGVSRDHKFSVKEGFRRLINPLLIAHPANCELIINKENQSKCDSCSVTIEELLQNIEIFENKYGKYYDTEIKIFIDLNELKEIYMGCVV
jgi:predicted nucleic acid-binding Zn ribbon protein